MGNTFKIVGDLWCSFNKLIVLSGYKMITCLISLLILCRILGQIHMYSQVPFLYVATGYKPVGMINPVRIT